MGGFSYRPPKIKFTAQSVCQYFPFDRNNGIYINWLRASVAQFETSFTYFYNCIYVDVKDKIGRYFFVVFKVIEFFL